MTQMDERPMSVPSQWTSNFNIKSVKVDNEYLEPPSKDAQLRGMLQRQKHY